MTSYFLYGACIFCLIISFYKDKSKTIKAIKCALKSFESIMPQFLSIIIMVSFLLSILNPEVISSTIGEESGFLGVVFSAIVGSIAMMPTFVAFSTGDTLLQAGAGFAQVAALISTLTMVSVLTFSMESSYIGKKAAFYRNFIAFLFSILVGVLMEVIFFLWM